MTGSDSPARKGNLPRVLISAYACNPHRGSEHGTGWKLAWELARNFDIHVLTRAKNRPDIEKFLKEQGREDDARAITAHFLELPSPFLQMKSRGWLPLSAYYALWQVGAFFWSRKNLARLAPDLCHHLTFNSFEFPSLWHYFKPPCILGPLGGGQIVSPRLLPLMKGRKLRERVRSARVAASGRNPLVLAGLRAASGVVFANAETRQRLEPSTRAPIYEMVDVGVDCSRFQPARTAQRSETLRLLYVGKMETRKGVLLLPEIARHLHEKKTPFQLSLVGDGPELPCLREQLRAQIDQGSVLFLGRLAHADTVQSYQKADFLLFPSIRDTSGAVVLEALACGCPVLCFQHQGAAWMVSDRSGVLINAEDFPSADKIAEAFVRAAVKCWTDPTRHQAMREAARKEAEEKFSWPVKASIISTIYNSCLAANGTKLP